MVLLFCFRARLLTTLYITLCPVSALDKFSNEQISDIAGEVDAFGNICHINGETGEIVYLMAEDSLIEIGISLDDDEDRTASGSRLPVPDWQKEMIAQEKVNIAKIDSWGEERTIVIEKPASHESFQIMRSFVAKVIPEGRLKEDLEEALLRSKPFRNFKTIIDNCQYREDWFKFKQTAIEEYVRDAIEAYDLRENNV